VDKKAAEPKYFEGLKPVDVYLNFEKQDFKTTRTSGSDYLWWDSRKSFAGIDYRVSTYGTTVSAEKVQSVLATAQLNGLQKKDIIATKQFLIYTSSLTYKDSDPQKAGQWVDDNFNNDNAKTVIAGVEFTLLAPTEQSRTLTINPNPETT
jgi:hypothetical protein